MTLQSARTIPGFSITERLNQGSKSVVYRARRMTDGSSVVLKLAVCGPTPHRITEYRHEYELVRSLDLPGVVKAQDLIIDGSTLALVFEDFGGIPLHEYYAKRGELRDLLGLLSSLCETLAQVHQRQIIHKDIKPANILVGALGEVKLTDFSIASVLAREQTGLVAPHQLVGTLAYMAPEQTGRMNRGLDHRADLYSLGVSLYELLAQRRPFLGSEPLELIHAHIAKQPIHLSKLSSAVPQGLGDMIAKLMQKNAEDRYQSACGVRVDVGKVMALLERGQRGAGFQLGEDDPPVSFRLPEKLYGRDRQREELLSGFRAALNGDPVLTLVSGHSGVGKSRLVHELHKPIAECRGTFVSAKFDPFSYSVPFASLLHPLEQLISEILSRSSEEVERVRSQIQADLGPNISVLTDLLPVAQSLLGEQPPAPAAMASESQRRVAHTLVRFLRVFAKPSQPLVIFFDDLQWADGVAMRLLNALLTHPDAGYLYVIGAYRHREIEETHPLFHLLGQWRTKDIPVGTIKLKPLDGTHIRELLADTFAVHSADMGALAVEVEERTRGNPFLVREFLWYLYQNQCVTFDHTVGRWGWSMAAIREIGIPENLTDLVVESYHRLGPETQHVLRLAAILGVEFEGRQLAIVYGRSPGDAVSALWGALEARMVIPRSPDYRLLRMAGEQDLDLNVSFFFSHDRVRDAVMAGLSEDNRELLHLMAGRRLLAYARSNDLLSELLFPCVDQLNQAVPRIQRSAERAALAGLNFEAAKRVKVSTAYEAAANYLDKAIILLGTDGWQNQYTLMRDVTRERAEVAYLSGSFERAQELVDQLYAHVREVAERVDVSCLHMGLCVSRGDSHGAIRVGTRALKLLGIEVPEAAVPIQRLTKREHDRIEAYLRAHPISSLARAPDIEAASGRSIIAVLNRLFAAANLTDAELFALFVTMFVSYSIQMGCSKDSSYGYMVYGFYLATQAGEFERGYRFGQLGIELNQRYGVTGLEAKLTFVFASYSHFRAPLHDVVDGMYEAIEYGSEAGDYIILSYACSHVLILRLSLGHPLSEVEKQADRYLELMKRTGVASSTMAQQVSRQLVRCLQGQTQGPCSLSDVSFDEQGFLMQLHASGSSFVLAWYYAVRVRLLYLYEHVEIAAEQIVTNYDQLFPGASFYFISEMSFYLCLVVLRLRPALTEREELWALFQDHRQRLSTWSDVNPSNYLHMHLLVSAEWESGYGNVRKAAELYEDALDAADEQAFLAHSAIIAELAGQFYQHLGRTRLASFYVQEAAGRYQRCGALLKAKSLMGDRELDLGQGSDDPSSVMVDASAITTTTSEHPMLDLSSLLKASQAMVSEVHLHATIEKILFAAVENAGATRGVLLLVEDGNLQVRAEYVAAKSGLEQLSESLDETSRVPHSLVHLVFRTGEQEIVQDGLKSSLASSYLDRYRPRSVLGLPMLLQGERVGVLYLENDLASRVFTRERTEILRVLSAQAASAIENARLYGSLQEALDRQVALTQAHRRFVPHEFLRMLCRDSIIDVKLGDSVQKEMTVLFSDIKGYTTLLESLSSAKAIEVLNAYLGCMEPVVLAHHGFIDNYVGDAIMALFEQAEEAVSAGVAMLRALERLNHRRAEAGEPALSMGIGINTGPVTLGTIGGQHRIRCSVIGDSVNLASRIEQLTRTYDVSMLISEHSYRQLRRPGSRCMRAIDRVQVVGKSEIVTVYEVYEADLESVRERKLAIQDNYEQAVALYYARSFGAAEALFVACRRLLGPDRVLDRYLDRCRLFQVQVPNSDWNGAERLKQK